MSWNRRRSEVAALVLSTIGALAVLRLVDTQVYTEPWAIDPWLYTALMTNFDATYSWFSQTYYASRVPAYAPGLALNSFLTPQHAYVVLHLAMFLAGGAFLYLLVRSLFDVETALFLYPVFLTNAAYVDAHTWDYVDGFVITYLAGGIYFLASSIGASGRWRLALAGVFFAAAAATNLFAAMLVFGAVVAYAYGRARIDGLSLRSVVRDAAWFIGGAAILLAACSAFAREHGGRTLFFMPSVDAARTLSTAPWKLPTYSWIWAEPRLLIPPVVVGVALLAWPYRRRSKRDPMGLALTCVAFGVFALFLYWELARSGTFLQLGYYFDLLYPFVFVALAAAVVALVGPTTKRLPMVAVAGLGLIVGAVPLVAVYRFDRAELWGRRGSVIAAAALVGVLLVAAALRFTSMSRLAVVVAPFAAVLVVAGVNYASAASSTTHGKFESRGSLAEADDVFSIGVQLMDFMRRNGLQESLPAFWYDASAEPALTGLQSLYYYGFSYLNTRMPVIDDAFRWLMSSREPTHVVLLCTEPTCANGANAIRRAGYRLTPVAATKLSSGSKSIWVQSYAFR